MAGSAMVGGVRRALTFFGPKGFVLRDPKPCEFVPCNGQLGFFDFEPDEGVVCEPKPWMLKDKAAEIAAGFDNSNAMTLSDCGDW